MHNAEKQNSAWPSAKQFVTQPLFFSWTTLRFKGQGNEDDLAAIGVLLGCFGRKIVGDSWFTWWFNHLPGPSNYLP